MISDYLDVLSSRHLVSAIQLPIAQMTTIIAFLVSEEGRLSKSIHAHPTPNIYVQVVVLPTFCFDFKRP